jgi:hypothetical protein
VKDLTNQIIGHYRNKPENSYQCNTALKLILKLLYLSEEKKPTIVFFD